MVEWHSATRFARQRQGAAEKTPRTVGRTHPLHLTFVVYNAVYWVPIVLALLKVIEYRTGFVAFLAVIVFRAAANFVRGNFLSLEQAEVYPFRI